MPRCADCPAPEDGECDQTCELRLEHPVLRDTGNGPTVSYENELLAQVYGASKGEGK